ncbi:hypothetical protein E2C01_089215 [Portunus trituberculatus]|uniref:Uncharacterized protein n=1 Tax=Portunus trituberculatus TaxID=210409 RepID=A0A5B7JI61_PORTR|nr:hypothetical protein [Portunus trituberculatus]
MSAGDSNKQAHKQKRHVLDGPHEDRSLREVCPVTVKQLLPGKDITTVAAAQPSSRHCHELHCCYAHRHDQQSAHNRISTTTSSPPPPSSSAASSLSLSEAKLRPRLNNLRSSAPR